MLAAFVDEGTCVESQAAFLFERSVAGIAFILKDRLDVLRVVNAGKNGRGA
jgi:hypothetical protein